MIKNKDDPGLIICQIFYMVDFLHTGDVEAMHISMDLEIDRRIKSRLYNLIQRFALSRGTLGGAHSKKFHPKKIVYDVVFAQISMAGHMTQIVL